MPKPVEPPRNPEKDTNFVQLSQIEPIRVVIDPSSPPVRSVVRTTIIVLLFLFIGVQLEKFVGALTYLFFLLVLSVFFAYLLYPLVNLIRRPFVERSRERWMPRPLAIVIAYLIVFSAVGITVASIAPGASEQGRELARSLPAYGASIQRTYNELSRRFDRLRIPEEMQARVNEQASAIGQSISSTIGTFFISLVTFVPWMIIIPVLSFFFLKDVNVFRIAVLRLFPAGPWRQRADSILSDANETLAAYARAQILSCLLIGTVCTIAFYLIGLKYALLLGVLAGIFEFVPLLGPLSIGLIATATAAFGDDPWKAWPTAIFLVALRVVHDYFTYPRIVRGGIHLHPLAIILSVLAGEQIAGIPGVFLAIPVVALFTVVYRHFLEHQGATTLFEGLVKDDTQPGLQIAVPAPTESPDSPAETRT